ncbi:unnamed protein product [Rotaria magnacalcarata]|uniref:PDZ domain-containing protein n=3 Tax=Rotaria magnacalcarata TaxID=392030 RepID=A0A819DW37_9BILA|nr:unnamed protein product [Rotaria magnacalcarata]CAF1682010.1 unnamed protein product [Rotaria magnacalcarata]CAF1968828.1 unnamed protein product [Rotaria magnacalcarata]CAF2085928.1 unnamed protein product [Rotaria magnacalcarata]CAF2161550.1 unnamed protein product [Rotaria magnacalcarata]
MDNSLFPTVPVFLDRSSLDQSWGFRLQGGIDYRLPLSIKKVSPNTPSHNKLYAGDGVTAIDGQDASSMKHEDAENLLRNALQIQLAVRRGQFAAVRPSRPPVKFGASSQPHVNSALQNTTTPNNYRRF